MATRPLMLSSDLAPWHNAGVYCLIYEDNSPFFTALTTPATSEVKMVAPVTTSTVQTKSSNTNEIEYSVKENTGSNRHQQTHPEANATNPAPGKYTTHTQQKVTDTGSGVLHNSKASALDYTRIPQTQWPAAWSAAFAKTRPAPVVWTYKDLGEDLLNASNPKHSEVLKFLIGRLALPKGTNAFWPISVPENDPDLDLNRNIFISGLDELGCKVLICFGHESLAQTKFDFLRLHALHEAVSDGKLIIVLPGMEKLVESPVLASSVLSFLQGSLKRFNIVP